MRLYKTPTDAFVKACAERDIHILLSISWAYHIDFMQNRRMLRDLMETVKTTVRRFEGNPTIASYFVGNEIDATMVRWLGAARVKAVLEEMIGVGRRSTTRCSSPTRTIRPTEYLNPESADYLAYNVYLEDREPTPATSTGSRISPPTSRS